MLFDGFGAEDCLLTTGGLVWVDDATELLLIFAAEGGTLDPSPTTFDGTFCPTADGCEAAGLGGRGGQGDAVIFSRLLLKTFAA